jgi:PPP family 3-phenylpropionic acid transporter
MPRFFASRGLSPEQIGALFGLGTAVRLISGPVAGRVADISGALRTVLGACTLAAAAVAMLLLHVDGFRLLLGVALVQAAVLAPTTTLADALALDAATPRDPRRHGFEYGWVRGAASVAFIAGSLLAGQVLRHTPLDAVLWMHAALLAVAAAAAGVVPPLDARPDDETPAERQPIGGIAELLGIARFRWLMIVAALVLGSHAMHDGFAMLRWNAAGIGPGAASVLWSESVAAEVLVFFVIGPALLHRVGPAGAMALAAAAGVVRWTVAANTAAVAALASVQPLHGLTFALLHLACMQTIAAVVPVHLAATAQSFYGVGAAATTALLTLASGALYARLGAGAFLVMGVLCAVALPLTFGLRGDDAASATSRR